jgi:hypothetical protein
MPFPHVLKRGGMIRGYAPADKSKIRTRRPGTAGPLSPQGCEYYDFDSATWESSIILNPALLPRENHVTVWMPRVLLVLSCLSPGMSLPAEAQTSRPAWVRVTEHAEWSPRDSAAEVVWHDRMWLMGGWVAMEGEGPRDVWSSADGRRWTQVTASAPWTHGDLSTSLVHRDRLWLIAGWSGGRSPGASASNEVWSSADGEHWDRVTASAPWKRRLGAAGVIFHGRMWLFGGSERYFDGANYLLNDIWSSEDGEKWVRVTEHAPWSPRAYHGALVFNDRIWILGGGNYRPDHLAFNDVWCSPDGAKWTRMAEHAPWRGRIWFSSVAWRSRIWILGGWADNPSTNLNDVWHSTDGRSWERFDADSTWSPRHEMSAYVFDNRLWIVAGNPWPLINDVWSLSLPASRAAP